MGVVLAATDTASVIALKIRWTKLIAAALQTSCVVKPVGIFLAVKSKYWNLISLLLQQLWGFAIVMIVYKVRELDVDIV